MDHALHDRIGFARQHERHGAAGGRAGVDLLDQPPTGNVEAELVGRRVDAFAVADQDRLDQAGLDRQPGAAERIAVLRADDGGLQLRQPAGERDEAREMVGGIDDQAGQFARRHLDRHGRRVDHRLALADDGPGGVADLRLENGDRRFAFLGADDRDGETVADVDATAEFEGLRAVHCARAGQQIAEHRRDQRAYPHRRRHGRQAVGRIAVRGQGERVGVARDMGEQQQVLHRAGALDRRAVADLQLNPGLVADDGGRFHAELSWIEKPTRRVAPPHVLRCLLHDFARSSPVGRGDRRA